MNSDQLKEEWVRLSTPWIKEAQEGKNPTRTGLLDPPMLEACGNVEGLRIIDSGCGEGRFCRILAEKGAASVLGLDLCGPMIEAAKKFPMEQVSYRQVDVQDLNFLEDQSIDLAISYLNQCDLPDFKKNTKEIYRILVPGRTNKLCIS